VQLVAQEIINLLAGLAVMLAAKRDDTAIGEIPLLVDLVVVPPRLVESGKDVFPAGVGFVSHG
jgi:hypothetical protein